MSDMFILPSDENDEVSREIAEILNRKNREFFEKYREDLDILPRAFEWEEHVPGSVLLLVN